MTVAAVAGFVVPAGAGPAAAHVEVSADKTTAGAQDVTLTFTGEAERAGAGIRSERVVLPDGLDPASVTPVEAPPGWAFARTADGFTVGGDALGAGVDAEWKVRIAKLPDGETRLSFKTLETYANGDVERWIEIQEPGRDEPDRPAPLITLQPGPSSAAPVPSASPATTTTPAAAVPADERATSWWTWLMVGAVALIAVVLVVRTRLRRSAARD
jgi:uncharacterized protein YcnI